MKEIDILLDEYPLPDGKTRIRIFDYDEFTAADRELLNELTEWLGVKKEAE